MVKVKVCGLTSAEDAQMVCNNGADFVGAIVDVKVPTPREISPTKARKILEIVPEDVEKVVVTMPENVQEAKIFEDSLPSLLNLVEEVAEDPKDVTLIFDR
ncbi:hypothetical protein AKJ39_03405, partial [candidate division MSBL1 archaeon SCGC-AAA259J03]